MMLSQPVSCNFLSQAIPYNTRVGNVPETLQKRVMFCGQRITQAGLQNRPRLESDFDSFDDVGASRDASHSTISLYTENASREDIHRAGVLMAHRAGLHMAPVPNKEGQPVERKPVEIILPEIKEEGAAKADKEFQLVRRVWSAVDGLGLGALRFYNQSKQLIQELNSYLRYPIFINAGALGLVGESQMPAFASLVMGHMIEVQTNAGQPVLFDLIIDQAKETQQDEGNLGKIRQLLSSMQKTREMRPVMKILHPLSFVSMTASVCGIGALYGGFMVAFSQPFAGASLMAAGALAFGHALALARYERPAFLQDISMRVWDGDRHVADFLREIRSKKHQTIVKEMDDVEAGEVL